MEYQMENLASKAWWMAAGTRAIKTAAQAAIGSIGASAAVIGQVNWEVVAGAAALAAIVSLLTSLEGLPEMDSGTGTATYPATTDAATTDASDGVGYDSPKPTEGATAGKKEA